MYMKYNNKPKLCFPQLWQIYLPCLLSFMFEANMKERWIFKRSLSTFPHNYFYFKSLLDEKSPPCHCVISTICAFIHTRVWTLRTEHAVSILIKARPHSSKSSQCCYTCFVLLWQWKLSNLVIHKEQSAHRQLLFVVFCSCCKVHL